MAARSIVWSDGATRAHGAITARGAGSGAGGFAEVSGHGYLEVTRAPELTAGGTWLHPYNIEVVADGTGNSNNDAAPTFTPNGDDSRIEAGLIAGQLTSGINVILDTGGAGSPGMQAGNIAVNAGIASSSTASLTLNAASNVDINAPISLGAGAFNTTAGGNMTVTSSVNAAIADIAVGGALTVTSGPTSFASIVTASGQSIAAGSIAVLAQGQGATIQNTGGDQKIKVTGSGAGAGIDVQNNGATNATISNSGAGAQMVEVTDADYIRVQGTGGLAAIFSGGKQTISITGSGANRIDVGAFSANALSQIVGRTQNITAGFGQAGGINIVGTNLLAPVGSTILTGIFTPSSFLGNSQTISTSGMISIIGGSAANQAALPPPAPRSNSTAGIVHGSNGAQTITAAGIELQGGLSGNGNNAFITSNNNNNQATSGNQVIRVGTGGIRITGGGQGSGNTAGINTIANQTISGLDPVGHPEVAPDITMVGGATGGDAAGNNAVIMQAGIGRTQTINAGKIKITAGDGIDAAATMTAGIQRITTTGDVQLAGSGGGIALASGARIGGLAGPAGTTPTDLV